METQKSSPKLVGLALIPFAVLAAMIAFLFGPGQSLLNAGVVLPEVAIERVEFQEGSIVAFIRNTGPLEVTIAQADVNDRIMPAAIEQSGVLGRMESAKVIIPFSWNAGQPYEIGVTTSDGTRFSKLVEAAAPTPEPTTEQISLFTLIGTYVGIIPVLIGLLWYPFIRRLSPSKYSFFLSLTAGLLLFLGIDTLVEASEIATENVAGAFNGQLLIATVTIVSFLSLLYVSERLLASAKRKSNSSLVNVSLVIALMVAIGIGLHNLGEGLAIGGAMLAGEAALSTFLIVGFTLHNTTEGLAIVSPMAKTGKPKIPYLIALGFIAGTPAIFGIMIGGFVISPVASIIFLAVGAGAIFQVVYAIIKFTGHPDQKGFTTAPAVAGLAAGMLIMYMTALLI